MKLHHPAAALSGRRRLAAAAVTLTLGVGAFGALNLPTAEAADLPADVSDIVLNVGATSAQRAVTWYATTQGVQGVQYAPTSTLVSGAFPASATTVAGTVAANVNVPAGGTEVANGRAVLTNLAPGTEYSYRVGSEGHWSPTYTFKVGAATGDYDFLFFGDPQIGSSTNTVRDGDGWVHTMDVASQLDPNAELFVSGGDQVDAAANETQWDQFLRPAQLKSTPWAATIGNHDVGAKNYEQHFELPNLDRSAAYYANSNPASNTSGGDYWYIFKDTLFIDLNSNSYSATTDGTGGNAAHVKYVTDVINAQQSKAKWTVLVYHHSIYSPADHANDGDNALRRKTFPETFSKLGVNLVLQGHDHSYSRSYLLNSGQKANAAEQPKANDVFAGPGGVLYVTANSASGSKYYDLTRPDLDENGGDYGPDPLDLNDADNDGHVRHFANSVENQEHVPTYVRVSVSNKALTVANIRSGECDGSTPNAAVELNRVSWCGEASNTLTQVNGKWVGQPNPKGKVGTLVDQVKVHRVLTAPASAAITGTPVVGGSLAATVNGAWQKGTTASYTWKADGVAFGGKDATVALGAAQVGKKITVDVTGNNDLYESATVSAPATAAVAPGTLASAKPRLAGKAKVGQKLKANAGSWTAGTALGYQWLANGKAVKGATDQSLKLTNKLKGKKISVRVTGTLAGYATAIETSKATGKVAKAAKKNKKKH